MYIISTIEVFIIAFSLAMDACCVNMANGLNSRKFSIKLLLVTSILFAIFQGIMPILGYYFSSLFGDIVNEVGCYLAFVLLVYIGITMILESEDVSENINYKIILSQGLSTSIDALAVGISFQALQINLLESVLIISLVTLVTSALSFIIGNKFSKLFGNKLKIVGGVILILMGIKILVFHFI